RRSGAASRRSHADQSQAGADKEDEPEPSKPLRSLRRCHDRKTPICRDVPLCHWITARLGWGSSPYSSGRRKCVKNCKASRRFSCKAASVRSTMRRSSTIGWASATTSPEGLKTSVVPGKSIAPLLPTWFTAITYTLLSNARAGRYFIQRERLEACPCGL